MTDETPQKTVVRLSLDLSKPMFRALADRATQEGQTKSAVVRSALSSVLRDDMQRHHQAQQAAEKGG